MNDDIVLMIILAVFLAWAVFRLVIDRGFNDETSHAILFPKFVLNFVACPVMVIIAIVKLCRK